VFTRPADLADSRVAEVVQSAWQLVVESIEYVPVGFGSHHWNITAAHGRWFVTVDSIALESEGPDKGHHGVQRLRAALSTARLLRDFGLAFVLAPIPNSEGELLIPIGDRYVVAVYPFIEGKAFDWGPFPDRASSMAVLERLVTLHTAPPAARLFALADDFQIPCRIQLTAALRDTPRQSDSGVYAEATRRLLLQNERAITGRLARYEAIVSDVKARLDRSVITHGEPHRANTIVTSEGVVLVDWDTLLIAPPERDLWWLGCEDVEILAAYEEQTAFEVDLAALDLYRLRWDLTDLALFTDQLLRPHNDDQDSRTAWEALSNCLD
jgi:aminoglycoside phosphotransferase (APT) family kinase protein